MVGVGSCLGRTLSKITTFNEDKMFAIRDLENHALQWQGALSPGRYGLFLKNEYFFGMNILDFKKNE